MSIIMEYTVFEDINIDELDDETRKRLAPYLDIEDHK